MRRTLTHALAAALLLLAAPAFADGPGSAGPDVAAPPVQTAPSAAPASAEGRTGRIALDGVTLNVPQGYRFYSPAEAHAFLQRRNAPAPSGAVLGLIAPAGADIHAEATWAAVLSVDSIGYVQSETASGLGDSQFEADVRAARARQGRAFEGFIVPASFNPDSAHLIWAERAAAPGSRSADLRHEQRALGRESVVGLTAIGSADQLGAIEAAAGDLRAMLSFPEGQRHADFQPATDRVSAYTVPGLVTGVAADQATAAAPIETGQAGFAGLSGLFPWIAGGVVLLAIGGYFLMRRRGGGAEQA